MKDENGRDVDLRGFIKDQLDKRERDTKVEARLSAVEQRQTWVLVIGVLLVGFSGFIGFMMGKIIQ